MNFPTSNRLQVFVSKMKLVVQTKHGRINPLNVQNSLSMFLKGIAAVCHRFSSGFQYFRT